MNATLESLMADFHKPGAPGASIAIIRNGTPLFVGGYGLADTSNGSPCTPATNFRLASVTKQFTAMAVMLLVERGRLKLDEPLKAFFPEFPEYGRQITVRHLLTHSSGLPDYEDLIPPGTRLPVRDLEVLWMLMGQQRGEFVPGSSYHYSNGGYALLSLIVETRSGLTFARFFEENIFKPLAMDSSMAYQRGLSQVPQRAYGHVWKGNRFEQEDQSLTSSVLGDGGIYSSVTDLLRWERSLSHAPLVSAKTLGEMFTPAIETDRPGTHYGFGWYIDKLRGRARIWHSGETRGFTTRVVRFPELNSGLILLANRSDAPLAQLEERLADAFLFE